MTMEWKGDLVTREEIAAADRLARVVRQARLDTGGDPERYYTTLASISLADLETVINALHSVEDREDSRS